MIVALVALFISLSSMAVARVLITSSSQVQDGVLTLKDFKKKERNKLIGPAGADGAAGAPGAAGGPGGSTIGTWHYIGASGEIPFGSTFGNYKGGTPNPLNPVRFRLEGDVVRLEGTASSTESGLWKDFATRLMFTLPEGFRPKAAIYIAIGGQNSEVAAEILVNPSGATYLDASANSGFMELTGATFVTS